MRATGDDIHEDQSEAVVVVVLLLAPELERLILHNSVITTFPFALFEPDVLV